MATVIELNDHCDLEYPDNAMWAIHDYCSGSYEGSGDAFCYDGKHYYYISLGHCSCYGPGERSDWERIDSVTELRIYNNIMVDKLVDLGYISKDAV